MWDIEVALTHSLPLLGYLPPDRAALWGSVIRNGWLRVSDVEELIPAEQVRLLRDIGEAVDSLAADLRHNVEGELYRVLTEAMGDVELARRTTCENCHDELPITGGIHDPGQLGVLPRPPFFCDQNCLDQAAERRGSAAFQ